MSSISSREFDIYSRPKLNELALSLGVDNPYPFKRAELIQLITQKQNKVFVEEKKVEYKVESNKSSSFLQPKEFDIYSRPKLNDLALSLGVDNPYPLKRAELIQLIVQKQSKSSLGTLSEFNISTSCTGSSLSNLKCESKKESSKKLIPISPLPETFTLNKILQNDIESLNQWAVNLGLNPSDYKTKQDIAEVIYNTVKSLEKKGIVKALTPIPKSSKNIRLGKNIIYLNKLKALPKDLLMLMITNDPASMIPLVLQETKFKDWDKLYFMLFKKHDIPVVYSYPKKYPNMHLNALINKYVNRYTQTIACGSSVSYIIKDGVLYSVGKDTYGQLGRGMNFNISNVGGRFKTIESQEFKTENPTVKYFEKVVVQTVKKIISVSSGKSHVIILLDDGTIMGCGNNKSGQLGLGDLRNRNTFEPIIVKDATGKIVNNIIKVSCGTFNSLILLADGTIMGCGSQNKSLGYLPDDIFTSSFVRKSVKDQEGNEVNNIIDIVCGYYHSLILLKNGKIMGVGDNNDGQLGINNIQTSPNFIEIPLNKTVVDISVGNGHSLILLEDGTVMTTGTNESGQLGLGLNIEGHEDLENEEVGELTITEFKTCPNVNNIVKIWCKDESNFALRNDGRLLVSGSNSNGQLGIPDNDANDEFEFVLVPNVNNVIEITSESLRSLILLNNGDYLTCGQTAGYGISNPLGVDKRDIIETSSGNTHVNKFSKVIFK